MRKAAISCWNLVSPFAAGIGLASAAVSFIVGLYYNTLVAYTLIYLFASLTSSTSGKDLPFSHCPPLKANISASPSSQLKGAAASRAFKLQEEKRIEIESYNKLATECQVSSCRPVERLLICIT